MKTNRSKKVLITGGTGYIGSWIVKGLLEKGYHIKLPVRNINKKEKYQFLLDIGHQTQGRLEVFEAHLLIKGSYDEAAQNCSSIIHTASPFTFDVKNPTYELLEPAVLGTENVLQAANASKSVQKVVLTSSVGAIIGDMQDMKRKELPAFTEENWNTSSNIRHKPYEYSKTMAEKKAWDIAKQQNQWELAVMNPFFVMGPPLSPHLQSESINYMLRYLKGKYKKGVPELHLGYVDVRDVARAHIYALENKVSGRHILCERTSTLLSFAQTIESQFPNRFELPKKTIPKWMMYLLGPTVGMKRKYIKTNIGHAINIDNTKSKKVLKIAYIPIEKTIHDMVQRLMDFKRIEP